MSDTLHEGPGVMVHIPAVLDPATREPIPLVLDVAITITPPNGAARQFARRVEGVLTSTVGFNLYIPEATTP